jgi:hypothetical protein
VNGHDPLVFKDDYKPGFDGRYPRNWSGYYQSMPNVTAENVSAFLTSDDPLDRVAAGIWLDQERARLPEVWVVIEDPETSPNLQREGLRTRTVERQIEQAWSAHLDEADAVAWRDMFQAKSDAMCDRHHWWGPESRRKFRVVRGVGAPATQLRIPGAEPKTAAFE